MNISKWITDNSYTPIEKQSPTPMTFRKRFTIEGEIQMAIVTATAMGIYTLCLNGKRIEDCYFAPGFTSYSHQLQYQTYDVTEYLMAENELVAVVGGGWAVGKFTYAGKTQISEDRQALKLSITIKYANGKTQTISTDESWQVSEQGNFRFADWYDGETYDATVDLNQIEWKSADKAVLRCNPNIVSQYGEKVTAHEIMSPISHYISKNGEIIYDFGQNFAGVVYSKINAKHGQTIVFRHAEVLLEGELFVKSLRTAKATATYIATDGEQVYSPLLTYMGFRYVGVSGISKNDLELKALVLHSDVKEIGGFECSNPNINRLQQNIKWGGKSNFVDIPTDCPQRDERQGWTGDISVFASTACFNFDMSKFLKKWLLDMKSEQGKGGGIPMVVPKQGDNWPTMATSCWGDSCILVPWAEYKARGDKTILEDNYSVMTKFLGAAKWWAQFLSLGKYSRRIWRFPFHFGDWCAPDETIMQWLKKGKWVGTAYFANSCKIVAEIADILGKSDDAEYYKKLREEICDAYEKKFTNGNGKLKKEFQTGYVLPLYFDMVSLDVKKKMAANLVELVKKADYHLTTGFTGTPYLLFALSDNGYADVAYKVLLQDTCPSWLYEVKAGGTTIWERWDALRPDGTINIGDLKGDTSDENSNGGMVSFNHYANGAVGDWLYRRIAGIEATSPGYKTFDVKPLIGGGLTFAKAFTETPNGRVSSEWHIEGGKFTISVECPQSSKATVYLPTGEMVVANGENITLSCDMS